MPNAIAVFLLLSCFISLRANPTITPEHKFSWGANIGWINWRPNETSAAQVTASYLSGYIYSANVGWINLGNKPTDGLSYKNTGSDFGVNLDLKGNLRGYAWSGNIGWIVFEDRGVPRIDPDFGDFEGYAWSANAGWITLGNASNFVETIPPPAVVDLDADGIADAWELLYAQNLTTFGRDTDSDQDGVLDLDEFLAGTDPTDPLDPGGAFRIVQFSQTKNSLMLGWISEPGREYVVESSTTLLTNSWKTNQTVQATQNTNLTSITLPISGPFQFFRIKTDQPPSR